VHGRPPALEFTESSEDVHWRRAHWHHITFSRPSMLHQVSVHADQDAAANWIKLMHTDRDYNASFKPFLDTLPHIGEVLSPEMWTPEMIAESQSDDLVRLFRDAFLQLRSAPEASVSLTV